MQIGCKNHQKAKSLYHSQTVSSQMNPTKPMCGFNVSHLGGGYSLPCTSLHGFSFCYSFLSDQQSTNKTSSCFYGNPHYAQGGGDWWSNGKLKSVESNLVIPMWVHLFIHLFWCGKKLKIISWKTLPVTQWYLCRHRISGLAVRWSFLILLIRMYWCCFLHVYIFWLLVDWES